MHQPVLKGVQVELKRLKTLSLQEEIQMQLKLYIAGKGMKSGDLLPTEKELAAGLGTSRTVIRETLRSMESLGIIEVKPGVGRFLRPFNFQAILDNLPYFMEADTRSFKNILEVRIGLETHFLLRDLSLFTPDDISELDALVDRLALLVDTSSAESELISVHTDFHCALFRHSDNVLLLNLIKVFATIQRSLTLMNQYRSGNRPNFLQQHRNIVSAIRAGDAGLVRQVVLDHFQEPMAWVDKHSGSVGNPGDSELQEAGK